MNELEELRKSFRPGRITTLFVGESAPDSGKFFYSGNSSLYHAMKRAFGSESTFLDDFRGKGFYLDDLVPTPINKLANRERTRLRWAFVAPLAERLIEYKPRAVVIVMRAIQPMVQDAMRKARLPCQLFCTPHPAFGNWTRFHIAMTEIIDSLPVAEGSTQKELIA